MVAYQVLGDGPFDVVYVPGAISHVELQWDAAGLATLLRGLAEHARVLVFDKRGTGMSDRIAGTPALEERSDDIRAVMDAAGSDRAALVGVSEGALAIHEAMREVDLQVRIGLHAGECEVLDGKVAGIAVSIGARVSALAAAGQVLVSQTVKDLVAGSGITFDDQGVRELKGVPGQWRVYAVANP
jgi:class 3 adenylate cyclase